MSSVQESDWNHSSRQIFHDTYQPPLVLYSQPESDTREEARNRKRRRIDTSNSVWLLLPGETRRREYNFIPDTTYTEFFTSVLPPEYPRVTHITVTHKKENTSITQDIYGLGLDRSNVKPGDYINVNTCM